jgi:hypothetical protein
MYRWTGSSLEWGLIRDNSDFHHLWPSCAIEHTQAIDRSANEPIVINLIALDHLQNRFLIPPCIQTKGEFTEIAPNAIIRDNPYFPNLWPS